jgi:hypothetical protein
MKVSKFILFLIVSTSVIGQDNKEFLNNWKSYPVPTDPDVFYNYAQDENDWLVYLENNEIKVDEIQNKWEDLRVNPPFKIRQSKKNNTINISAPLTGVIDVIEVQDGYLIGFNRGEWGGELYWFSKNGKKRYKISGHQIEKFIERDNKIYAIEGLAHITMSYGSVIEIRRVMTRWFAKKILKLPSAPCAVQSDSKDNFIIMTTLGFLSMDRQAKVDTLSMHIDTLGMNNEYYQYYPFEARGLLGMLYPNSMVIQNDVVYVGMRKGVYKFDLTTRKEEWLLPE